MGTSVAMGSDFNGVAGHVGPRFGSDACGADAGEEKAQGDQLEYPFTIDGFGRFTRQKTGHRTFDFNVDGLAHAGLVPDLVADVGNLFKKGKENLEKAYKALPGSKAVPVMTDYVGKLFGSAEKYIQMWEKALAAREGPIVKNVALLRPAWQSGTNFAGGAIRAVDGNRDGNSQSSHSVSHTANVGAAWWQVDLEGEHHISAIRIYNRTDCCSDRLKNFWVMVSKNALQVTTLRKAISQPGVWSKHHRGQAGKVTIVPVNKTGRYVRIQLAGKSHLSLAEVEVLGRPLARDAKMGWAKATGKLVRIAVGSASHVWGVNAAGQVFRRIGTGWQAVPTVLWKAADIGAGPDGSVWAVSTNGQIFELTGWGKGPIWTARPGRLARIAVGGDGLVWGTDGANKVFRWEKGRWLPVPVKLAELGVGADGTVWGVSPAGEVLRRNGNTWSKMPGSLSQISVGSAKHVWGVNGANEVWRWDGTAWKQAPGGLAHIGAGVDGSVWGTAKEQTIWRLIR